MTTPRARFAVALGTLVLVACGGTVVPVGSSSSGSSGSSSSSGASGTSGGSSSGASSSGASSSSSSSGGSSGASGSSGTSSGGSSGGFCYPGQLGPPVCFSGCNGGPPTNEICVNGQFTCPPTPPCPPPICGGPPPICSCPANCKCGATCDPASGWICTAACEADAGAPFACGNKNCVPGDVCIDVAGVNGGPDTGPYQCLPNPALCANDYSCGCEEKAIEAAGTCTPVSCDQTFGNVVVHCKSL